FSTMARRLRLTLLGGFEARWASGQPIALPSKKARALLAYLAFRPGQEQDRDKLATLLWGDTRAERARHSLRQVLVTLRHAVSWPAPRILIEDGASVALNRDAADVDVQRFQTLVASGTLAALEKAAALYQGDLLEGLDAGNTPFEDWLLTERERLRELA